MGTSRVHSKTLAYSLLNLKNTKSGAGVLGRENMLRAHSDTRIMKGDHDGKACTSDDVLMGQK